MNVNPISYTLVFEPDLKKFTFNGAESVSVTCKRPTDTIKMDCAELKITSCHVVGADGRTIRCAHIKTDEEEEELHIKLEEKIRDNAVINLEFSGILNDRLVGFYRSQYRQDGDGDGKTKYMATSQFESADARRAFPCWDQPDAKATFEISIITNDSKLSAISNMPIESKKRQSGNRTLNKFAKTPVVSTYLIYLGVGEFEYLKGRAGSTQIRIVTTAGNKSKGRFSLQLAKKLLASYEEYFGIKYPLPKLDLIAIPDFAAGAMENWGAITFRETILLYDPKTSSTRTKQYIAEVISHEIAHQWFGNLVTMKWWNDLWLNESFATFMATKFVDKFYPEWDLWNQFIEDAMNTAMQLDSLKTTHPIDVKVRSPTEIREIFDAISYDKGGCILRMLEHYVGEPNFQKGLRKYLDDFKYKNAAGQDLWDAIGKASGMPVSQMVNTWLKQPGFPLVEISQDGDTLKIEQKRYLLEYSKRSSSGLWHIPISLEVDGRTTGELFTKRTMSIKIPKNTTGFVANHERTGFYRVRYDDGILLDLKMLVDEKRISAVDRWAVQNDLFSLCISGDKQVRDYLDFSDAYLEEDSYLATTNVAGNLASLYFRSFDEGFAEEIRGYAVNYFRVILSKTGWTPRRSDRHTDALLRSFAASVIGKMDDGMHTDEILKKYANLLKVPESLHPDLIKPICSSAAWNKDDAGTHAQLVKLYKSAKTMEEKLRYLSAMCWFKDKKLLVKSLDFSLTSKVRSQNIQLPIMEVAANPYGKKVLWPWLKKNWKNLSKKVGQGNPLFNRIVASIASIADDSMEEEIRQFFKDNPTPGTERTQDQTLEKIRINSKFIRNMRREFKDGR